VEARRPRARKEVYTRSGEAVVKTQQHVQRQKTRPLASLHIPREDVYVFRRYNQGNCFRPDLISPGKAAAPLFTRRALFSLWSFVFRDCSSVG